MNARYIGGIAVAGQAPRLFYTQETDGQRADRLASEVGRLNAELTAMRQRFQNFCEPVQPKGSSGTVSVPYGGDYIVVAYEDDSSEDDSGRMVADVSVVSICINGRWVNACECGALADSLNDSLLDALRVQAREAA